jgi:hypothetical protein
VNEELQAIAGYSDIVQHFDKWPSFHDAEITRLDLNRSGLSVLSIYVFNMLNEIDDRGYYKLANHAVVHFRMEGIESLELHDFSGQNVIFGLELVQENGLYKIDLDPCFGLSGSLTCRKLSLALEAGIPKDKINLVESSTKI